MGWGEGWSFGGRSKKGSTGGTFSSGMDEQFLASGVGTPPIPPVKKTLLFPPQVWKVLNPHLAKPPLPPGLGENLRFPKAQ